MKVRRNNDFSTTIKNVKCIFYIDFCENGIVVGGASSGVVRKWKFYFLFFFVVTFCEGNSRSTIDYVELYMSTTRCKC